MWISSGFVDSRPHGSYKKDVRSRGNTRQLRLRSARPSADERGEFAADQPDCNSLFGRYSGCYSAKRDKSGGYSLLLCVLHIVDGGFKK